MKKIRNNIRKNMTKWKKNKKTKKLKNKRKIIEIKDKK